MDIISHAIVGRMFVAKEKHGYKDMWLVALFGALPDFFQLPLYLYLGNINHRPYSWPLNSDWIGFRSTQPTWVLWWEIPHSIFTLLLIIIPLVFKFKLNKLTILAYFSHIFLDLFTHTGEWGMKPFFPLQFMVNGFTDAWTWNPIYYPLTWGILWVIIIVIEKVRLKGKL